MHGRGEGIVGGLGHVDVVVGVEKFFAGDLIAAVGDDSAGVHVGLRAAARLPDNQGEMVVELAGDHFIAGGADGLDALIVHALGLDLVVGEGGGFLEDAESVRDLARHDLNADLEVFVTALRLRGPVAVGGHLHLAHRVAFDAVFHARTPSIVCLWASSYSVKVERPAVPFTPPILRENRIKYPAWR